jgi:hypothetical protein
MEIVNAGPRVQSDRNQEERSRHEAGDHSSTASRISTQGKWDGAPRHAPKAIATRMHRQSMPVEPICRLEESRRAKSRLSLAHLTSGGDGDDRANQDHALGRDQQHVGCANAENCRTPRCSGGD